MIAYVSTRWMKAIIQEKKKVLKAKDVISLKPPPMIDGLHIPDFEKFMRVQGLEDFLPPGKSKHGQTQKPHPILRNWLSTLCGNLRWKEY